MFLLNQKVGVAMTLANYLADSLYVAKLSQAVFAKKVGVTASCVSLWLSGKRVPKIILLEKISIVLAKAKRNKPQKELAILVSHLLHDLKESRNVG